MNKKEGDFDSLSKADKEEEKNYYFFDDPDEEKITFTNYRRGVEGDFEMYGEPEDDCSDCDKDCKSKILADLATNDSNSYIFEQEEEEREACKFLTRLGLLEKVEDDDIFEIEDSDSSLQIKAHDDFELFSPSSRMLIPQKDNQIESEIAFDYHKDFPDIEVLTDKHKELLEEGLPELRLDDEGFTTPGFNSNCQSPQREMSVDNQSQKREENFGEVEEVIDTTSNATRSRKKTTEFNNILERKVFRALRKYYKNAFETFGAPQRYKKRVKTMSPEEMDQMVLQYMKVEFDFLVGYLAGNELIQMITCLKRIILSDRYNKCERVTYGIDFTTTRNVFNKYSTKALNDFISIPTNSILLVHFFLKQGRQWIQRQNDVDMQKLERQFQCLVKIGFNHLPPSFVEIYSHANCQIINFLN